MRRSIRNTNIPPPGIPRAFESFLSSGSREFDLEGHPMGREFGFAWVGWVSLGWGVTEVQNILFWPAPARGCFRTWSNLSERCSFCE